MFFLPDRKATAVRKSGLDPHPGEDPAVDDVPGCHDTQENENIHQNLQSLYLIFNIYLSSSGSKAFSTVQPTIGQ
jgi:hypothetical protein